MENKETIEEAAESYAEQHNYIGGKISFKRGAKSDAAKKYWAKEFESELGLLKIELNHTKTLLASCEKALEERDKQQKERYSEEEVRNIANWAFGFYRRNDLDDDELGDEFNRVLIEIFKTK